MNGKGGSSGLSAQLRPLHWGMDFQGGEGEAANGSWDFVGQVPVSPRSWVWEGHGDS